MIIDAEIYKKAKELYAATGGSIESVAGDLSLGNPAAGVARALGSPEGLNLTNALVARALGFPEGCNFSYGRIARALRDGLSLDADEVAWALHSPKGMNLDAEKVAKALRDGLNLTDEEVTRVLKDDLAISADEVARALKDGLNLTVKETAKALRDGLDLSAPEIAQALRDGLDLYAEDVASALYSKDGLNLDAEKVAEALRDGLNLEAEDIAKALRDGLNLTVKEVARVLHFKNGLDLTVNEVAKALRDGLDLYVDEVAEVLYSEDGLNLSVSAIAEALKDGINSPISEVASELFPLVKWDPVELFNSLQGCGMTMTDLISAMLNAPEKFNAGDIAGVFQRGFGLSIPEVAKRMFEEEPNLDVESRALTLRCGLGAGIIQAIDILRDNGVAAADAKKALWYVFSDLRPENIEKWVNKAYGTPTWLDRTTALFSCRMEFYKNLDCDGSPFSESRFSPSTLGDDSIASCFIKAVKSASESSLDDMTGVRVELTLTQCNPHQTMCFKTDLASVEKVLEMIQNGVIQKMDPNSLFRWDEENQIFSIGGSGSAAFGDLDFPIVRVEDHACVEIASVKGRAEIRNDAIVSIGRVGGSIHVTDRASCVAKVVAGDANLWGSGTLTVGSAGNLVNKGMNPILVQPEPVVEEPPATYKTASELRAAKNTSKKGIK